MRQSTPFSGFAKQSISALSLRPARWSLGMMLTATALSGPFADVALGQTPAAPVPASVMAQPQRDVGPLDALSDEALPDGVFSFEEERGGGPAVDANGLLDPSTGEVTQGSDAFIDMEMQELDAAVDAAEVLNVSAKPAGWMLDQSALEEIPYSASSGRWFNDGRWYASGESLWLDRSRTYRRTIAIDTALLPPPPYDPANIDDYPLRYTTVAKPFNVAPGARATLGRSLGRDYLNRDRAFEFTYYGGMTYEQTDGWNALGDSAGDNTLVTPLALRVPGYNGAGYYTTAFNSDFNSYEWNFKMTRRLGRDKMVMMPNGEWSRHAERAFLPAGFVGVRLANVNEDFFWQSGRDGVDFSQFGGNYQVHTENWLLGMNFGGELISKNEFFWWGLRGRAAPCLSFASESQANISNNYVDPNFAEGSQNWTASDTLTGPAFLGDLSLMAGFNLTPNFSFKAGYEFLWVAGIATATRQFNLDQRRQDPIDAGGQTFFQGLSFGFEGNW